MRQAGLLQHAYNTYIEVQDADDIPKLKTIPFNGKLVKQRKLNMTDLSGAFYILVVGIGSSVLAFIGECAWAQYRRYVDGKQSVTNVTFAEMRKMGEMIAKMWIPCKESLQKLQETRRVDESAEKMSLCSVHE